MENLVVLLLQSRIIIHIMHLRITGPGSFAGHLALGDLYEMMSDYADKLAEQWQGLNQKILNYPSNMRFNIPEVGAEIEYIKSILTTVDATIEQLDVHDKVTANILQDLAAGIRQQIYKLTFLK